MAKKIREDIKICKHCGSYIDNKSRVKRILSDAENSLKRYNKKFKFLQLIMMIMKKYILINQNLKKRKLLLFIKM